MRFNYDDERARYSVALMMREKLGRSEVGLTTKELARSMKRHGISHHEVAWVALKYPNTFQVDVVCGKMAVRLKI